jgi:hypothetical protein
VWSMYALSAVSIALDKLANAPVSYGVVVSVRSRLCVLFTCVDRRVMLIAYRCGVEGKLKELTASLVRTKA